MKTQADGYRNPLLTARPVMKGRITGMHYRLDPSAGPAGAEQDWRHLPAGEMQPVPAGAMVRVKGAAGRIHCFLFEEDGSMSGPLMAIVESGPSGWEETRGPFPKGAALAVVALITLGVAGVVVWIGPELALWSQIAKVEFFVTLFLGWVALCGVALHGLRGRRPAKRRSFEIAPPRASLK